MQEAQETWIQSLGWEDPLEKEMTTTPVFLPGKFHGQGSLAGRKATVHEVKKCQTQLNMHAGRYQVAALSVLESLCHSAKLLSHPCGESQRQSAWI